MGEVIVRLKIYLEDSSKIEEVKEKINGMGKVPEIKEEELGFGIKFLKTIIILDEDEGIESVEKNIKNIDAVKQVEIESVDRAL